MRHLRGTNRAGLNRVAWNLTEDAPRPWLRARSWNRGPNTGANVVPGVFSVGLRVDGTLVAQERVRVRPDPRVPRSFAAMTARRDFVRTLHAELSRIDAVLNALDALGGRLAARPDPLLERRRRSLYRRFTSDPTNSEDQLLFADGLRERLANLLIDGSLSDSPPTPAQQIEAANVRAQFTRAIAAYRNDAPLRAAVRAMHEGTPP